MSVCVCVHVYVDMGSALSGLKPAGSEEQGAAGPPACCVHSAHHLFSLPEVLEDSGVVTGLEVGGLVSLVSREL